MLVLQVLPAIAGLQGCPLHAPGRLEAPGSAEAARATSKRHFGRNWGSLGSFFQQREAYLGAKIPEAGLEGLEGSGGMNSIHG